MTWKEGEIEGCTIKPLQIYSDHRGWLGEFFRSDELPDVLLPAMGYLSLTKPGIPRGPHAHVEQTDLFLFFSGTFQLYLWDARKTSPSYCCRQILAVGQNNPTIVIVPPGVVHAYWNIGDTDALVINCPNRLYAGEGKKERVDEIRYEDVDNSPFIME